MPFSVPGLADDLTPDLLDRWNKEIDRQFRRLEPDLGSQYFTLEPDDPAADRVAVTWFGNPAEPEFCLDAATARTLSDWGVRGRRALHNEYCEYAVISATDTEGRVRPKRVQVTTELPEYYLMLAEHAPARLREIVTETLGTEPRWQELYGPAVADPQLLAPTQRRVAFARHLTGHGQHPDLIDADVPAEPAGSLNAVNALFMAHPINGLDDLIYIVMFGAKPYARRNSAGGFEPAGRDQIFRQQPGLEALSCRHADPAAALAAADAAFHGRTVSFADPLGMYIQQFTSEVFLFEGGPVPDPWIRLGRGQQGLAQRLEFGPSDDDPHFLDEITVVEGDTEEPLTGGYEVVRQVQVGPIVALGAPAPVPPGDFVVLADSTGPIRCRDARVCSDTVGPLKEAFDAEALRPGLLGSRPRGGR
ncbi:MULTISPECIES: hypothetical protein [unclassified Streptomyces]|uniref:hypothetical protein n=1 Tax=unclassified Streptomyces TaxID=2593676 RepID=UPI002E1156A8|nr:hypothetical protein OG457_04685 [Streptomyces sp. NBC_01207]